MLVFHWFYKVSLTDRPAPDWGVQQQGHFRSDATLCDLLVFPMVLEVSGNPCSDPAGSFFLPSRKCLFSIVLKVLGEVGFLTGVLYNDLKRQALFMLYGFRPGWTSRIHSPDFRLIFARLSKILSPGFRMIFVWFSSDFRQIFARAGAWRCGDLPTSSPHPFH